MSDEWGPPGNVETFCSECGCSSRWHWPIRPAAGFKGATFLAGGLAAIRACSKCECRGAYIMLDKPVGKLSDA